MFVEVEVVFVSVWLDELMLVEDVLLVLLEDVEEDDDVVEVVVQVTVKIEVAEVVIVRTGEPVALTRAKTYS